MKSKTCDPSDHLQESPGPPSEPEIPKKSRKESFWGGLQKSPRKYPKKSNKFPKNPNLGILGVFFDFFGYFRGLFCRPPKRLLSRLFWDKSGARGPGATPVNGSLGSQGKSHWFCAKSCPSRVVTGEHSQEKPFRTKNSTAPESVGYFAVAVVFSICTVFLCDFFHTKPT